MKKTNGSYKTLKQQLDRLSKYNNQGSIQTRRRYTQAMDRFCKFLSEKKVQNIKNIQPKHLEEYINNLENEDCKSSYIKTELSGIRFYHSKIDNPKFKELPSNDDLKVERRTYRGTDKSWTDGEYKKFKQVCISKDREDIMYAAEIARKSGMRIHEVTRLSKEDLGNARNTGYFTVKGKGGKIRTIPLENNLKETVDILYEQTDDYNKVFIEEGVKTHNYISDIQNFIGENREDFQDEIRESNRPNLSFHGLRASYSQDKYYEAIDDGDSVLEAELKVSELLGHNRAEVTRIYLGK